MTAEVLQQALKGAFDELVRVDAQGIVLEATPAVESCLPVQLGVAIPLPNWKPGGGSFSSPLEPELSWTNVPVPGEGWLVGVRHCREKTLQHQLELAEARLQTTLEVVSESVLIRGSDDVVQLCSRAAREELYAGTSPVGRCFHEGLRLFSAEGTELAPEDWPSSRSLRAGLPLTRELVRVEKGDQAGWWEVNVTPLLLPGHPEPRGTVTSVHNVTQQREYASILRRRDAILHAVSECASVLLASFDLDEPFNSCMQCLGEAAQADRLYIYQANRSPEGKVLGKLLYSWHGSGVPEPSSGPEQGAFDLTDWRLEPWLESMLAGNVVQCRLSTCSEEERALLKFYDLKGICLVPMLVGGVPWGVLGMDAVNAERSWSDAELEALVAAATLMRTALQRRAEELARQESEARYRTLFQHAADPILLVQANSGAIHDANIQAISLLGLELGQLQARNIRSLVPQTLRGELMQALARSERLVPLALIDSQQNPIPVDLSCSSVLDGPEGPCILAIFRDVSERERAIAALRISQERLKEAQRIARMGDWEYVHRGRLRGQLTWSEQAYRMVGHDPAEGELTAEEMLSFIHPADREEALASWQRSVRARLSHHHNLFRVVLPSGYFRWIEQTAENLFDERGRLVRSRGTIQDVTKLKETERALQSLNVQLEQRVRERTAEVQDLYEFAPCGYHSLDLNRRIVRINHTHLSWLQRESEEVLGRPFEEFLAAHSRQTFFEAFETYRVLHQVKDVEIDLVRADGTLLTVLVSATATMDASGRPVSRTTLFDISDLKHAQRELAEREAHLRDFIENASDLVQSLDPQGRYLYANPAWCKALGYLPEEIGSLTCRDVVHPDDISNFLAIREQMFNDGRPRRFEVRFLNRQGKVLELEGDLHVAFQGSDMVATRGIFRDITARQRTAAQLQAANEAMTRAARLKDEFLASMSHELRTPLTSILGMTEALEEGTYGDLASAQLAPLQTIRSSGTHLLELINDILDLSKVEAGQMELTREPVRAADLCCASLQMVKGLAKKKQLKLEFDSLSADFELSVDPRRVKQILVNLLSNAVKFTPEGGHIRVTVAREESLACFRVRDSGIGIDSRQQARLFQPFVQLDSRLSRQYSGTGLGLALVRRLCELHGGTVELESQPEVGTCVTVRLPLQFPPEQRQAEPGRVASAGTGAGERVLVVEDNENNRKLFTEFLQSRGYRALPAEDAFAGLKLLVDQSPQLVIMDIQMPGMDGLEAIRRIRGLSGPQATVPILALTALAMPGDREACLTAGATRYREKPVELHRLEADVHELLHS